MKQLRGNELSDFIKNKIDYDLKERFLIKDLHGYIMSSNNKKVCCLYGLRRTGKTVMMLHEIRDLDCFEQCLFIQCDDGDTVSGIKKAIEKNEGCKYVFIDEATKTKDLIKTASVLADVYMAGRKIVISGTDSLGLLFARYNELYDRAVFINTTYIPFKEYNELLGRDIMDYIRYGGTLSPENVFYNNDSLNEYSNSAITYNIVNSLKKSDRFRNEGCIVLEEMLENGNLPSLINKVIEYPTREFLVKIINRDFESHDLGSLVDLIVKSNTVDPEPIDTAEMSDRIRIFLGIKEKIFKEADVRCTEIIISYLKSLDVLYQIPRECYLDNYINDEYIFTQSGMRYCQASDMAYALVSSDGFQGYTISEKKQILKKLDDDICGGILEDIIFYQLSRQFNSEKCVTGSTMVTKYRDEHGREIDVLVLDLENKSSVAIEVKLSLKQDNKQARHLLDDSFCSKIEEKAGVPVINKVVVYRGETSDFNSVLYINAEEFLRSSRQIVCCLLERHCESVGEIEFIK